MFSLTKHPDYDNFSVRPVNKSTDRYVIREIFRREFYGNNKMQYPDEGLWEIYDRMDTTEAFGAYLVSQFNHILFLLEVHPAIQMDLRTELLSGPGTIGIYCFFHSLHDPVTLPAFKACIGSLFNYSNIHRVLTTLNHVATDDTRTQLLQRSGFSKLPDNADRMAIYSCTRESFCHPEQTSIPHNELSWMLA